jgi:NhaA family Na+:H+ antiporter
MTRQSPPIDRILAPLRAFTDGSASGGLLLMLTTVIALVWVNSPWAAAYDDLWHMQLGFRFAGIGIEEDLHFWVNDALMAVFFLVIGLEIKREVLVGELHSVRQAALPAAAAVGGAVVPAIIFLLLVGFDAPATRGWGVPMATDIAFALGMLALMGRWAPFGLRVFLTALAIVDDLLAVVVIAVFYTDQLDYGAMAAAGVMVLILLGMNALGVRRLAAYAIPGIALWFAVYQSGVHATIAGVLLALTIPARTRIDGPAYVQRASAQLREVAARFRTEAGIEERHAALWELEDITQRAQAPMLRMEHALHPWVAFLIVPLFALANAGIRIPSDLGAAVSQPVVVGIVVGLVLGKQLGITAAAWLVIRSGFASLPDGVGWRHMYGAAWLGGSSRSSPSRTRPCWMRPSWGSCSPP